MCRTPLAGFFVFALALGVCQPIAAQTTADRAFADLGRSIHPGNTILVTSRDSGEMRGKLVRLSPTSLVIAVRGGQREILSTEIGRIERVGDPLWTGALIGAIPVGWFVGSLDKGQAEADGVQAHVMKATLIGGAVGALIGAAIDASHEARTLVYRAQPVHPTTAPTVRIMPVFGPSLASVMASVQF